MSLANQFLYCSLTVLSKGLIYEIFVNYGDGTNETLHLSDSTTLIKHKYIDIGEYVVNASISNSSAYNHSTITSIKNDFIHALVGR